jgi:integration host factor subunit alpha
MSKKTVTRAYLTEVVYTQLGLSQSEAADMVDAIIEEVVSALDSDGLVKISSFGSFQVRQKNQRIGRNPKTKEEAVITPRKVVSFYASNLLKKRLNDGE